MGFFFNVKTTKTVKVAKMSGGEHVVQVVKVLVANRYGVRTGRSRINHSSFYLGNIYIFEKVAILKVTSSNFTLEVV